jgi:hypothetical protein
MVREMTTERIGAVEAAAILGCHPNTIRRIPPEQLPFWRLGNRGDRRYDRADIERYRNRHWAQK